MDASALEDEACRRSGSLLMASIAMKTVAELAGLQPVDDARTFTRLASFADADSSSIVFAQNESSFRKAFESAAGLILTPKGLNTGDRRVLEVDDPKLVFALCGQMLEQSQQAFLHASAVIEDGVLIGLGTSVAAGAVIEAGAKVGQGCRIGANVTIHGCVSIGDGCVIQAGAVLGSIGFGYVQGQDGRHVRFPQIGTLHIEDDVEIGANTTIDRGALGETRIGRGTKIDNLVHIAHNCHIGERVLMAAQVGLAGSCVIEDAAMLGGQVGLGEKVTVGKGVILGGQGGLLPGKRLDGEGQVFWGTPARPVREYLRDVARMRRG